MENAMHRLKVVFILNISKELAQFSRSFALLFSSVRSRFSLLFAIESTVQFERGLARDKKEAYGKVDRHCYFMPKKVFPNNSYLMAYVDPFVLSFFTVLHDELCQPPREFGSLFFSLSAYLPHYLPSPSESYLYSICSILFVSLQFCLSPSLLYPATTTVL